MFLKFIAVSFQIFAGTTTLVISATIQTKKNHCISAYSSVFPVHLECFDPFATSAQLSHLSFSFRSLCTMLVQAMVSTGEQLKLILWRNYLSKRRNKRDLAAEVLCKFVIALLAAF